MLSRVLWGNMMSLCWNWKHAFQFTGFFFCLYSTVPLKGAVIFPKQIHPLVCPPQAMGCVLFELKVWFMLYLWKLLQSVYTNIFYYLILHSVWVTNIFLESILFEAKPSNPSTQSHIDGSVQDCSNSNANTQELMQSCTKPLIWT